MEKKRKLTALEKLQQEADAFLATRVLASRRSEQPSFVPPSQWSYLQAREHIKEQQNYREELKRQERERKVLHRLMAIQDEINAITPETHEEDAVKKLQLKQIAEAILVQVDKLEGPSTSPYTLVEAYKLVAGRH